MRRIYGFDYLRGALAIDATGFHAFMLFVMPLHAVNRPEYGLGYVPDFWQVILLNVFPLAIPSFLTITLMLYCFRWKPGDSSYLFQRLWEVAQLYIFWSLLRALVDIFLVHRDIGHLFTTPFDVFLTCISGFRSNFWYFFTMMFLLACLYGYLQILDRFKNNRLKLLWLGYATMLALTMVAFPFVMTRDSPFNPLALLPVVGTAALFHHYYTHFPIDSFKAQWNRVRWVLLGIFVVFSLLEWAFFRDWYLERGFLFFIVPFYTRISLLAGSGALIITALFVTKEPPQWAKLLSNYALPIYCVHLFLPFSKAIQTGMASWGFPSLLQIVLLMAYWFAGAIGVAMLFRKVVFLKRFF